MIPYIKNKMKSRNARIIDLILLCCPIIQNSMAQEPASQQHTLQRSQDLHALIINASPGWITSKIYTNQGEYSWLSGMGFELSYRYLTSNGYGFSIEYAHNETTFTSVPYESLKLNYVGASFNYGGHISEKWIGNVGIGLGYAYYSNGSYNEYGLGIKTSVGLEWRFTKHVGVGVELDNTAVFLPKQDNLPKDYTSGIRRLSINAGLRIYI